MKIFISAVTSEFAKVRDEMAADLRARGHEVTIQSDFKLSPDSETLLGRLAEYIRDCNAVICIVGKQCGARPPAGAVERVPDVLAKDIKEASYTQWEFFLARHYKRRPYVYLARDDYEPDKATTASDRADLQNAYRDFLKADGVHYASFSNIDQLARAVLKDLPELAAKPEGKATPSAKPIVLPYQSIGDLFKGRDEFMTRLRESLTRTHGGRTAIVSQALYGLGGIGKTRVAVEYAWANAYEYNASLFVVAETPEALRRNLAALSATLTPQLDTTDDAMKLAAVLDWLRTNPGWFLILDNVDNRDALVEVEHLLASLTGGHVIITSRLADFPGDIEPLQLNVLEIDDAAAFLLERTKGRRRVAADEDAQAREIAQELGRLALALEQAAAFIGKRRLTFAQYLEQWRSKRDEVLAWFDPTVTGYPRAVAVTWQTSVAQLTEGGRRLLERLAWLAPEKVPESLLDVPIPGAEGENLNDAFDDLAGYSLVTRDTERPFFLIHRLVQDVTRRSLVDAARKRTLVEALGWIDAAFPFDSDDVRYWPTLEPLTPHARAVAMNAHALGIGEPTSRLLNQLGLWLYAKALHKEAETLYRLALSIDEGTRGAEHPSVAVRLNNLGQLLAATNRPAEAERFFRRATAIDEKSYGVDHPSVAATLHNLAQLMLATNRLTEAEPMMRRALAINEKNHGADHADVAKNLNNLAQLLKQTGKATEAEALTRRALTIDEKNYGPDHPEVAIDLTNLAQLLQDAGRLAEAESLMRRALAIDELSLGIDHPNVATDLNNLAGLLQATNRPAEAEPLMRRALLLDEKSYGADHPTVARDLNNLAQLLQNTGRCAEAEPLMRRCFTILVDFTRQVGHLHPHLLGVISNYRGLLELVGRSPSEIDAACAELMRPLAGMTFSPARNTEEGDHPKRSPRPPNRAARRRKRALDRAGRPVRK